MFCSDSEEIRNDGIEEAKKVKSISVFVQPSPIGLEFRVGWLWEGCAKVLASKTDDELDCVLYDLTEWIADPNWPGADIIYERLLRVAPQKDSLFYYLHRRIDTAKKTDDEGWLCSLEHLCRDYCRIHGIDRDHLFDRFDEQLYKKMRRKEDLDIIKQSIEDNRDVLSYNEELLDAIAELMYRNYLEALIISRLPNKGIRSVSLQRITEDDNTGEWTKKVIIEDMDGNTVLI